MNSQSEAPQCIYDVTHRDTGEKRSTAALNSQDACIKVGWSTSDCFVVEQKPTRKLSQHHKYLPLYHVPCLVCPFQCGECNKPANEKCPVNPCAPDLKQWLIQASEAHLCPYQGNELDRKDHVLKQKWVPLEEALKILTPKCQ